MHINKIRFPALHHVRVRVTYHYINSSCQIVSDKFLYNTHIHEGITLFLCTLIPCPKKQLKHFYCWQFARVLLPAPILNRDKLNQIDKIHVRLCSGARAKRQHKRQLRNIDTKQTFAKSNIICDDITGCL